MLLYLFVESSCTALSISADKSGGQSLILSTKGTNFCVE